ncbi:Pde1b, partial [Symbiodinium sp. KB8]
YSDRSVLENFHAAELIRCREASRLLAKEERFWMTSLILSTDMSKLMQVSTGTVESAWSMRVVAEFHQQGDEEI